MAVEVPIVRYFVPCRQAEIDPSNEVSLHELIQAVVRLPGEPFPCVRPEMALYALLTNGRGVHPMAIEFTFLDHGEERTIYRSPARSVDRGQDPTAVQGLPIPLKNVIFARAGPYTFRLLCGGQPIAEAHLDVR